MVKKSVRTTLALLLLGSSNLLSQDTLTITTYNLLNYSSSDATRDHHFRTVVRHAKPDVLVVQEITSQAAVNNFYNNVINQVFPGQFTAGTFIDGPDTDNGLYYKDTKFEFIANTRIRTLLRDINEFSLVYSASADTFRIYSVHLKASSGATNEAQRAAEVDSLRKVTNALPDGKHFAVMGDFNIYSSTEQAYQKLLQNNTGDDGNFLDPITMTGTWNNAAYAIHHTQSPRVRSFGGGATGGLDDRFDMILYSSAMAPGGSGRIRYVPGSMTPVGNDGNHYNDSINRLPNNAVPDSVANALHYASDHLPVSARFVFPAAPVPIQLAYLTAEPFPGPPPTVILRWGTVSEVNNFGFHVQRRISTDSIFTTLPNSFVPGGGTTGDPQHYTFTDSSVSYGSWFYRLRQEDLGGNVQFTDPVSVTLVTSVAEHLPFAFRLDQNYPNPFNPTTTIRYELPTTGPVRLKVFDILGREVVTLVNEVQDSGGHSVVLDAAGLASGVYVYRLSAGSAVSVRRMVLMK